MNELVSIVVPVYGSTESLEKLAAGIDAVFHDIEFDYELIFVDDASPNANQTWKTLERLNSQYGAIKCFRLMRNFGQQAATLCGIKHAQGDYIITMDDDLQHRPEDIPGLLEYRDHDVVIAKFKEKKHNWFKRLTSNIKGYFDRKIIGKPKDIKLSPFRLINASIAECMFLRNSPYPFIPALLFYVTKDVVNVEVEHYSRMQGRSNYTLLKMIQLFSNLMINNSSLLLRYIGYMGLIASLVSVVFIVYLVLKKMFIGISIEGWTSIMLAILFFGGMTLSALGIIGEYLIRLIATAESRPIYIIKSKLD